MLINIHIFIRMISRYKRGSEHGKPHRHVEIEISRGVLEDIHFGNIEEEATQNHKRKPGDNANQDYFVPLVLFLGHQHNWTKKWGLGIELQVWVLPVVLLGVYSPLVLKIP